MANLSGFGFREHPFAMVPASGITNWAGMVEERAILGDIVGSILTTETGLSEFVIIHGSYGAGKSHALKYLTTQIQDTRADYFKSRAIYLPKVRVDQKVDFVRLYKEIMRELGPEFFHKLADSIVQQIESAADALSDQLEREVERKLKQSDPQYFIKKVMEGIDPDDRPTIELLKMLKIDPDKVISYLFEGKPVVGGAGFTQAIDNDYVATKVLASIFRAMTIEIGSQGPAYQGVYLFIDEVEDIWDLRPVEQLAIWNGIRELLNRLPENFCMLLAFTGDAALLEATIPQALAERTSRQNIELQSLATHDAKQFIQEHLANFRRKDYLPSQPYYPFSEDAVDYVLETVTIMVPRRIFRSLRTVLERAIRHEGLTPGAEITAVMAEDILLAMKM